jgi:two-component system cell cycle sensor histidine kinase/response regulator CckA
MRGRVGVVTLAKRTSISFLFLTGMVAVTVLAIIATGALWITADLGSYRREAAALRSEYIESQKALLKNEVDRAIATIEYAKSLMEDRLREDIKNRTYEAYAIATNIYREYRATLGREEIEKLLRDALRPIRFNKGRGYYFATDMRGVEQLFADKPEMEGQNLIDMRDTRGAHVIRDMIALVRSSGEGYYRYTWTKPDAAGGDFEKISFIKRFEPFDWFIGTGEYLADVEKDVQVEALDRVSRIRFGEDGYIFVGQWDGLSLLDPAKGRNMWDTNDVNGVKIVQELISAAIAGGGFVSYVMPKLEDKRPAPKLSYAAPIRDWRWYVGTGLYVDRIDAVVAERQAALRSGMTLRILQVAGILAILLAGILVAARRLSRSLGRSFAAFMEFFDKAAEGAVRIDPGRLRFRELASLADSANDMTEQWRAAETDLQESGERLRGVIEHAHDGIALTDEAGLVIAWNKAMERLTAVPPGDALGRPIWDVELLLAPKESRTPEFLRSTRDSVESFLKTGEASWAGRLMEREYAHADGTSTVVQGSISAIRTRVGFMLVSISRDVTEERKAEREVAEWKRRYEQGAAAAGQIVYDRDLSRDTIVWSESVERVLGYSPREMGEGFTQWADRVDPRDRPRILQLLESARGDSTPFEAEYGFRHKDGHYVRILDHAVVVTDPERGSRRMIGTMQDISERKRVEMALQTAKDYAENLVQTANAIVVGLDVEGRVTVFNQAAQRITGYCPADLENRNWFEMVAPRDRFPEVWAAFTKLPAGGLPKNFENPILTKSGEERYIVWQNNEVREQGRIVGTISFGIDITERKRAEEAMAQLRAQFHQSQKMEAIGRLAGGIAHDFNNLLTSIIGYSDLLRSERGLGESGRESVEEIDRAAHRAASLTQQLLAFSRKQILQPRVIDVNVLIANLQKMLTRLIGEDILLESSLDAADSSVSADPGQIEQVITNLAVNARDAMPRGGTLGIKTRNVSVDESSLPGLDLRTGQYVVLTVSDTGIGMDDSVKSHLFEPFFTTKELGKGTGLGLSTVYGIVSQSGGQITVISELGRGTSFDIYLPVVSARSSAAPAAEPASGALGGMETILLVEDEESLLSMTAKILERHGYTVVKSKDPQAAVARIECTDCPRVDLLITDVIMPGMSGGELAQRVSAITPNLKVLFISGYTDDAILHHGVREEGIAFLQKPFSPHALAMKVREVLDRRGHASG